MLIELIPLYAVAAGFGALFWDIQRRRIGLSEKQPEPEEIEKFEIQKLAQVDGRITKLELSIDAVLDTVHAELDDARAERRSAQSAKAGATRKKAENEQADQVVKQLGELPLEEQRRAVRARYDQ